MGTRHLVCVKLNGDYKVSQFGSMGGQPQAAGVGCLNHLKEILVDVERFKRQLDWVQLVQFEDNRPYDESVQVVIPAHTVLNVINNTDKTIKFYPSIEYTGEYSCDWVYVIDLDDHSFKVYKGKNKDKSKEEKDFAQYIPAKNLGYRAVALLNQYDFDKLPTVDEFKKYYDNLEKEEDERLNAE